MCEEVGVLSVLHNTSTHHSTHNHPQHTPPTPTYIPPQHSTPNTTQYHPPLPTKKQYSQVQGSVNTPGDEEYLRHTSLKKYMPYMLGGGYILSADLAQVILGINRQSKEQNLLKLMASEDVTIGFWLMSVELRRVDHPKMLTGNTPCCFSPVARVPGSVQEARCVGGCFAGL